MSQLIVWNGLQKLMIDWMVETYHFFLTTLNLNSLLEMSTRPLAAISSNWYFGIDHNIQVSIYWYQQRWDMCIQLQCQRRSNAWRFKYDGSYVQWSCLSWLVQTYIEEDNNCHSLSLIEVTTEQHQWIFDVEFFFLIIWTSESLASGQIQLWSRFVI